MNGFFILISIILCVLAIWVLVLSIYLFGLKKKVDLFFKGGEENIGELLSSQVKELDNQKEQTQKILEEVDRLKNISQKSFQKSGLVRYNPFKNGGGDQSFSIALLDLENNGLVITSIYSREGNRTYAKPIEGNKSKYTLTEEEEKAIKIANGL